MQRSKMTKVIYALCVINGLCAVVFGGIMMIFPVNTPLGLSEMVPMMGNFPFPELFQNLFFPGLALFLCNGVCNLVAAEFFLKKDDKKALIFALFAGILLIVWDVYELLFLPNPAAVFYLLVGVAQAIMCVLVMRSTSVYEKTEGR